MDVISIAATVALVLNHLVISIPSADEISIVSGQFHRKYYIHMMDNGRKYNHIFKKITQTTCICMCCNCFDIVCIFVKYVRLIENCWDHGHQTETFSALLAFVRGIHRSPVNFLTKASDAELWGFLWCTPEKNGWVNNLDACDLRRHCSHCYVSVMHNLTFLCALSPIVRF